MSGQRLSGPRRAEEFARSTLVRGDTASLLVVAVGTILFLTAGVHHALEFLAIASTAGPVVAFVLDGIPALTVAYAGLWLARTDLSTEHRWTVLVWCLAGIALLTFVMGLEILVKLAEGRPVTEPQFQLLLAADAGAVAGFVAGYYHARTDQALSEAERMTNALAFVNGMLRHDLRNGIQVVDTYADLIKTETDSTDGEVSDHAETIRKQTDRVVDLIDNTEAVTETLAGDPDLERIDLAPIAAESAARVADAFDATVSTELPESAPVVANEGVRSVVENLVENAAEHNDADDPRVGVHVETAAETVTLRVQDNGPGVEDEDVFGDRRAGRHAGGLDLVEALVESYCGDVWVENNEPRGSVFAVELPRPDGG